ncbi:gp544 [Bacillus phage G]|uniref:Gp544 n=1 Tax=Bacillus phage G TaxID=2884420 RepID=G3MAT3_9CAUD|nr:gp544 [Bacillus phage G]AEO93800.1 gp544 [Bacillus phage G]
MITVISEIEEYLKELEVIKSFHVSIKKAEKSRWHVRDKLVIRIWVNKDLWDSQLVMTTLTEDYSFEENITKICKGIYVPEYDIYYE